ncbi:MAG: hypothetical protein K8R21_04075, partial [Leptospira sp.]|nr:hypothetical protein [Leptospira sp.]
SCEKINKCDLGTVSFLQKQRILCEDMLSSAMTEDSEKVYRSFIKCIGDTPCEKLNTSDCYAAH